MSGPTMTTTTGPVIGRAHGGTTAYLGVPFAAPPVGELRFASPRRSPSWSEPRSATSFGASPVQPTTPHTEGLILSEDCLTLNIWVPDRIGDADVLFWVYGGGFQGGSSALPIFDGARLAAEQGIVVVSANHRTGVLGFSALTGSGLPEASNLGVQDVIAALRWVHENVSAFGGDPSRVTLMGQSSGAFVSAALLAAPSARGLFHRLVLISGGASRLVTLAQARRHAEQFLEAAGIASDASDPGARLRDLPVAAILAAQGAVGSREIGARNAANPDSLGVVLDAGAPGPVLDDHPMQAIAAGRASAIPLLFVVTGAEVASLRGPDEEFVPSSRDRLVAEVEAWGAPDPMALVAEYEDPDLGRMRENILTDYIYRLPAARSALAQTAASGRAWIAQVDQPDDTLASHDLPAALLFGNLADDDPHAVLSGLLRETIGGFARMGSADWAEFETPDSGVMHLGSGRRVIPASFARLLAHWEGTPRP
ncbi:MAG: carboxylesterase/lipase family protein [Actinobacteria bacterium]|nr:carboxylesterase/lipase family protein [Actinomycetota bacterium]